MEYERPTDWRSRLAHFFGFATESELKETRHRTVLCFNANSKDRKNRTNLLAQKLGYEFVVEKGQAVLKPLDSD